MNSCLVLSVERCAAETEKARRLTLPILNIRRLAALGVAAEGVPRTDNTVGTRRTICPATRYIISCERMLLLVKEEKIWKREVVKRTTKELENACVLG